MPRFITLVGYPAVGKSTYAEKLRAEGATVISADEAYQVVMQRHDLKTTDEARKLYFSEITELWQSRLIEALKRGDDIVFDAANTSKRMRSTHLAMIKPYAENYQIEAVVIYPPEEEEHTRRLAQRFIFEGRVGMVNALMVDKLVKNFEMPTADEGYGKVSFVGEPPKNPFMLMQRG